MLDVDQFVRYVEGHIRDSLQRLDYCPQGGDFAGATNVLHEDGRLPFPLAEGKSSRCFHASGRLGVDVNLVHPSGEVVRDAAPSAKREVPRLNRASEASEIKRDR